MTFQSIGDLLPDGPVSTDLGQRQASCETHGPFTSSGMRMEIGRSKGFERWTHCPVCNAEERAKHKRDVAAAEAAQQQAHLAEMLGNAAIPPRFLGRTIDDFVAVSREQIFAKKTSLYYAQHFADSMLPRGKGLVMSGQRGTGKSHLACGILQAILPGHVGVFTTFMGMLNMIRSTYAADSKQSERNVIDRLCRVPLLVIDEIGVQRGTEDEHLQLFGILNSRYNDKLPVILLTNQDREGLERFVGDRLYDRITETTRWLSFTWDSYRPTMREQDQ